MRDEDLTFLLPARYNDPEENGNYMPDLYTVETKFPFVHLKDENLAGGKIQRDKGYRVLLHEHVHHVQYAATTYGLFSCLGRLTTSQCLASFIDGMSSTQWQSFHQAFSTNERRGLLDIERDSRTFRGIRAPDGLADADIWKQVISLEYALLLLRQDRELRHTRTSLGTCMTNALTLLDGFPAQFPRIPFTSPPADDCIRPGSVLAAFEDPFTTEHILEAAATANDFLATACTLEEEQEEGFVAYAEATAQRLFEERHTSHNKAFRVFLQNHPQAEGLWGAEADPEAFRSAVVTFLLLADLALNPPLPPVYTTEEWQDVSWSDIHPPIRFMRYLKAAITIPLFEGSGSGDNLKTYMTMLKERTGLTSFAHDVFGWKVSYAPWQPQDTADTFSLPESYAIRTFANFGAVRQAIPHFASALGLLVRDVGAGELLHRAFGDTSDFLLAPLGVDNQNGFYSYFEDADAAELAGALGMRLMLRSLPLFGPHRALELLPPTFTPLISEKRGEAWEVVTDVLTRYIGKAL